MKRQFLMKTKLQRIKKTTVVQVSAYWKCLKTNFD